MRESNSIWLMVTATRSTRRPGGLPLRIQLDRARKALPCRIQFEFLLVGKALVDQAQYLVEVTGPGQPVLRRPIAGAYRDREFEEPNGLHRVAVFECLAGLPSKVCLNTASTSSSSGSTISMASRYFSDAVA